MWPLPLRLLSVPMCDTLQVQRLIDVFEKWEAYDSIVCRFVVGDGQRAQGWRTIEGTINPGRVEDLIYTVQPLVPLYVQI